MTEQEIELSYSQPTTEQHNLNTGGWQGCGGRERSGKEAGGGRSMYGIVHSSRDHAPHVPILLKCIQCYHIVCKKSNEAVLHVAFRPLAL
jgi:hypothetical protein